MRIKANRYHAIHDYKDCSPKEKSNNNYIRIRKNRLRQTAYCGLPIDYWRKSHWLTHTHTDYSWYRDDPMASQFPSVITHGPPGSISILHPYHGHAACGRPACRVGPTRTGEGKKDGGNGGWAWLCPAPFAHPWNWVHDPPNRLCFQPDPVAVAVPPSSIDLASAARPGIRSLMWWDWEWDWAMSLWIASFDNLKFTSHIKRRFKRGFNNTALDDSVKISFCCASSRTSSSYSVNAFSCCSFIIASNHGKDGHQC